MRSQDIIVSLGTQWAARRLERCAGVVPQEWPGTLPQAREVVLQRANGEMDPADIDELALAVNRIACETWSELLAAG